MINHQNFGGPYNPPPGYRLVPDERLMTREQQLAQMYNRQPYQDQVMTNQQPAKPVQNTVPTIPARIIASPEEIAPNEVPSDMTPALFLQNDSKAIYMAVVNRRGVIDQFKYVLEQQSTEEPVQNESSVASVDFEELTNKVMTRLDDVMAELDQVKKMTRTQNRYHKPYYSKQKEEKSNA